MEYDVHDDDNVDDDYDFCKIIPFSILFPQTSTQVKCYGDETKQIQFLILDGKLLEKNKDIWDKVSYCIKNLAWSTNKIKK